MLEWLTQGFLLLVCQKRFCILPGLCKKQTRKDKKLHFQSFKTIAFFVILEVS